MTIDTTPAPALTHEQSVQDFVIRGVDHATFDRWLAARIARAKREAGEEIAQAIEAMPIAGFNGETLKWLKVAREMCAALARKVGADHA